MFRPVITAVVTNTPQHLEYFIDIYFIVQLFRFINKKYEHVFCVILGFRHEVDENCALLGHYAASSGNYVYIYIYIYIYISNKMQHYTVYFILKLLYMFRVVPPQIPDAVDTVVALLMMGGGTIRNM
jgi:hypothetical protein